MRSRVWVAAAMALAISRPGSANDTMMTLAAGGLVPLKSAQIVMESEDLEISVRRVVVSYRFRNPTSGDLDAIIGFPLPDLHGGDVEYRPITLPSKDPVNFVDFEVKDGDRPVAVKVDSRVFDGERNERRDCGRRV